MSKKSSSASSDPMAGFAAMMQAQNAGQEAALGQNWLDFAKQQFSVANDRQAPIDAFTAKVTQSQLDAQNNANQWSSDANARSKSIFQPAQDAFLAKANNWDSADNQAKAAAEAGADVSSNIALQKQQNDRDLAAKGIRPDSGAYAGINQATATEGALAEAGAENNARNQVRKEAIGLQGDAINMGNGLPGQAATDLSLGVGSGTSAESGTLAANNNWRSNIGIMNSGFTGAGSLFNSAGNAWGNVYKNRVGLLNGQDEMNNAGMNALAVGAGSLIGMAKPWSFMSDENAKEDKREVKGILKALQKMPVEAWRYKSGQGDGKQHIGPYAQDFKRATGLGDGTSINVIDALGVTMGAVKELAERVGNRKGNRARPKAKSIFRAAA